MSPSLNPSVHADWTPPVESYRADLQHALAESLADILLELQIREVFTL